MSRSKRARALRCLAAILVACVVSAPAAAARPSKPGPGAAVAPLELVPLGARPTSVRGLHAYFGALEIDSASDGLVVSNRLSLEKYLLGLAEVPPAWPEEALEAQAVAARTYALWTLAQPRSGAAALYDFDICASVQCQVFSGAETVLSPDGLRWAEAVASTEGRALVYEGAPILARYHSTSGGMTLSNEQAFPEEGPYPYLRSVSSTLERASPLYRWSTRFRLADAQAMLRRAGRWRRPLGRLVKVTTRPSASGLHYPDVVFSGRGGSVTMTAQEVREVFGRLAPRMFPDRYPSLWPTSSGRLPETLPSNRFEVSTKEGVVTVAGRGWGHGVGMSQWGAHGLASRGAGYEDILAHYYRGVTLSSVEAPEEIEVGLDWGKRRVVVSGLFRIVDGRGRALVERASGSWAFRALGAGVVAIDPPPTYGRPLRLQVAITRAPQEVAPGARARISVALTRAATLRTLTSGPALARAASGARTARAGTRDVVWVAPSRPGTYLVRAAAVAGGVARRSEPVEISVRPAGGRGDESEGGLPAGPLTAAAAAGLGLVALLWFLVVGTIKR